MSPTLYPRIRLSNVSSAHSDRTKPPTAGRRPSRKLSSGQFEAAEGDSPGGDNVAPAHGGGRGRRKRGAFPLGTIQTDQIRPSRTFLRNMLTGDAPATRTLRRRKRDAFPLGTIQTDQIGPSRTFLRNMLTGDAPAARTLRRRKRGAFPLGTIQTDQVGPSRTFLRNMLTGGAPAARTLRQRKHVHFRSTPTNPTGL